MAASVSEAVAAANALVGIHRAGVNEARKRIVAGARNPALARSVRRQIAPAIAPLDQGLADYGFEPEQRVDVARGRRVAGAVVARTDATVPDHPIPVSGLVRVGNQPRASMESSECPYLHRRVSRRVSATRSPAAVERLLLRTLGTRASRRAPLRIPWQNA
jgi:hypothetical protein